MRLNMKAGKSSDTAWSCRGSIKLRAIPNFVLGGNAADQLTSRIIGTGSEGMPMKRSGRW
jgi:hypothetical protein